MTAERLKHVMGYLYKSCADLNKCSNRNKVILSCVNPSVTWLCTIHSIFSTSHAIVKSSRCHCCGSVTFPANIELRSFFLCVLCCVFVTSQVKETGFAVPVAEGRQVIQDALRCYSELCVALTHVQLL
jgi:hypothetical protein